MHRSPGRHFALLIMVAAVAVGAAAPWPAAAKARASIAIAILDGADAVILVTRAPGRSAAFTVTAVLPGSSRRRRPRPDHQPP